MARFNSGWVKYHREMVEKDLHQNVWLWGIWTTLLSMATYKETQIIWQGGQRILQPGSVVFGITELSGKWECSNTTIWRWLKYLANTGRIVVETCTRGTLVTICNWAVYQETEEQRVTPSVRQVSTKCLPSVRQVALNEESKKERKKEERKKEETIGLSRDKPDAETIENPDLKSQVRETKADKENQIHALEKIYELYPNRKGTQRKAEGIKACATKLTTPDKLADFEKAVRNYAEHCQREGKVGTQYVSQFKTFVSNFWEEWVNPPPEFASLGNGTRPITKAQAISKSNDELIARRLAGRNYELKT